MASFDSYPAMPPPYPSSIDHDWADSPWQYSSSSPFQDPYFTQPYGYGPSHGPHQLKQEAGADYGNLIRALAPLATKGTGRPVTPRLPSMKAYEDTSAMSSSFASPQHRSVPNTFMSPRSDYSASSSEGMLPSLYSPPPMPYGYPPMPDGPLGETPYQLLNYMAQLKGDSVHDMSGSSSASSSRHGSPTSDPNQPIKRLPCLHPGCDRTFKREYTRAVHMTTHQPREKQRFKCQIAPCQEEFSRRHDRFRHEVHIHGVESEWKCHSCGKFFAKEITLVKHACAAKRADGW
ncbi:hypothetical protein DACRYDRAFT_22956 [Dacryopinax primogenitus]|uniref:C2H2-type domain-containing protein n=1 Tax=Dacryopinax primogenitus (strain DJM 731) TaxID=1858805 RepID=M5GB78_DACPD|nr:uncharacterized protein DACRYDRAFT_22956 [Dacryopinax primogenitus]EJU01218.1 hypothetical protein DACRYDRAFT_22956 [Dacryopinax primogenitus]